MSGEGSARVRSVGLALGAPGMGKSHLTARMIRRYLARFGPASVRGLDPSGDLASMFPELEWAEGCPAFEYPGRKNVSDWIVELTADGEGPAAGGWGPGLLVLDDADRFLTSSSVDSFRDVWLANRHLYLDVWVNAHRPQGVPKDLIAACRELWLFAMEEPHALEYLAQIPALRPLLKPEDGSAPQLPDRRGRALLVRPFERTATLVDLTAAD